MNPTMYPKTLIIEIDHWNLNDFKKTTVIVISNITATIVVNNIMLS